MASKLWRTDRDAANYGRMFEFKIRRGERHFYLGWGRDILWRGSLRRVYYINYGMICILKATGKPLDLPFV